MLWSHQGKSEGRKAAGDTHKDDDAKARFAHVVVSPQYRSEVNVATEFAQGQSSAEQLVGGEDAVNGFHMGAI